MSKDIGLYLLKLLNTKENYPDLLYLDMLKNNQSACGLPPSGRDNFNALLNKYPELLKELTQEKTRVA